MVILIVNDDGYEADGINVLAEVFCKDNDIYMVSPKNEHSCCSHSVSVRKVLEYNVFDKGNIKACSLGGTPADCVKFGILKFMDGIKPDLVLSGINSGPNMGADVMYSGTVAAASEAVFNDIPAIAVSLTVRDAAKNDYKIVAEHILHNIDTLYGMAKRGQGKYLINLNVPPITDLKGFKVVKNGLTSYMEEYYHDCNKPNSVILEGSPRAKFEDSECDFFVTSNGYASIVPVMIDRCDTDAIEELKKVKF